MTKANLPVDADIYAALRKHCDDCGIRFVDFVEDALENAIHREEILEKSAKAERVLHRATEDMRRAFRRGFFRGFLSGILTGQGRLALSQANIPPEVLDVEEPYKVITGPQLMLFE